MTQSDTYLLGCTRERQPVFRNRIPNSPMQRGRHLAVLAIGILIVALIALPGIACADDFVGGMPLSTVQTGTVTGDLWFNATPAPDWGSLDVTKTFTLPENAVGNITWARLYISAYDGHMQDDKAFTITNKFDGNGDGTYEQVWPETGHAPFNYVTDPVTYEPLGNDNTALGGGAHDRYKMINDHENRVTSDYFMWYDVTNLISSRTVNVNVNTAGSFDGRIKVITLVVAYNDPSSATLTTYYVNQGHDVCSYYTEEQGGADNGASHVAVGTTSFATTGLSDITSATLTADYMASNNGYYGYPTSENSYTVSQTTGAVSGAFTNVYLDRTADIQGAYSGLKSWDVTSSVSGSSTTTLGYSRYFGGTGTAAFYKIPLVFLVVKSPKPAAIPVAGFSANITSGGAPLTVQFTDQSTNAPTSWAWTFGDGSTSTEQNPVHTYAASGTYTVALTATNTGGSNTATQTGYITVFGAVPAAAFSANVTSGARPLTAAFTDASTNTPTSWSWDFGDGSTSAVQNPVHTYTTAGNYTVALTAANANGSGNITKTNYIAVTPQCDLTISSTVIMNPGGAVFPFTTNSVKITSIKNNGPDTITNIPVALYASDVSSTVPVATFTVASLASAGVNTTYVSDPTIRPASMLGQTVTYTAVIDPDNVIAETNEANNNKASAATTIKYNGYAGKRYTNGSDMNTAATFDGKYGLVYSYGNSAAASTSGTRTSTYSSTDLPVPSGATVVSARLYQAYRYGTVMPSWTMTFNGNDITGTQVASYADSTYYTSVYNEGLYVYDVTGSFSTSGNTLVETLPNNNLAVSGAYLVVVYSDPSATEKTIWINEEFDHLKSFTTSGITTVSNDQATAWANFAGVDTSRLESAKAIAICPFLQSGASATFFFDGTQYPALLSSGYQSVPNIAFKEYDVSSALASGANTARFQSTISGASGAEFYAANAILVMNKTTLRPTAGFTGTPASGTAPLNVTFTDQSENGPTTWLWDFGDGSTGTEQNPVHEYTAAGTYTVKLTATNGGGSDTVTKTGYITVASAVLALPDQTTAPTDPDHDGLYEDLNGNGGKDLNDAVVYFKNIDWVVANEPVSAFDYNGNGGIDLNDIILLYKEIIG